MKGVGAGNQEGVAVLGAELADLLLHGEEVVGSLVVVVYFPGLVEVVELLLPLGLEFEDLLDQRNTDNLKFKINPQSSLITGLLNRLNFSLPIFDHILNNSVAIFSMTNTVNLMFQQSFQLLTFLRTVEEDQIMKKILVLFGGWVYFCSLLEFCLEKLLVVLLAFACVFLSVGFLLYFYFLLRVL